MQCVPLFSRILSLFAESNDLQFAVPGGLIGVGTMIDPTLTRADRLVGQVLGSVWVGLGLTLTLTLPQPNMRRPPDPFPLFGVEHLQMCSP